MLGSRLADGRALPVGGREGIGGWDERVPRVLDDIVANGAVGAVMVAPLVAARYPRAAHVSGDVLSYLVVQGRVGFAGEPAEEPRRQLRLCVRNVGALSDNGILPIVEYPIDRPELPKLPEFMVGLLRAAPVMFVVLAPPLEVCRERNAARPAATAGIRRVAVESP